MESYIKVNSRLFAVKPWKRELAEGKWRRIRKRERSEVGKGTGGEEGRRMSR